MATQMGSLSPHKTNHLAATITPPLPQGPHPPQKVGPLSTLQGLHDIVGGEPVGLLADVVEHRSGEIALAVRRNDHDDQHPLAVVALRQFHCGVHGGARGNSHRHALLPPQPSGHQVGLKAGYLNNGVDQRGVTDLRDEPCADALDAVRAWPASRKHGALRGLHRGAVHRRLALLEVPRAPAHRAPGAHGAHEEVQQALGLRPDLRSRGAVMTLRVDGVLELLRHEGVGDLRGKFLSFRHGAQHPRSRRSEHHLAPVSLDNQPPLHTHTLRHGEDAAVALGGAVPGQRDPSVARSGLDDCGLARCDEALLFRIIDHRFTYSVLHREARVGALQLPCNLRLSGEDLVEVNHWGVPREVRDVRADARRRVRHLPQQRAACRKKVGGEQGA
eukprot:RCo009034